MHMFCEGSYAVSDTVEGYVLFYVISLFTSKRLGLSFRTKFSCFPKTPVVVLGLPPVSHAKRVVGVPFSLVLLGTCSWFFMVPCKVHGEHQKLVFRTKPNAHVVGQYGRG